MKNVVVQGAETPQPIKDLIDQIIEAKVKEPRNYTKIQKLQQLLDKLSND